MASRQATAWQESVNRWRNMSSAESVTDVNPKPQPGSGAASGTERKPRSAAGHPPPPEPPHIPGGRRGGGGGFNEWARNNRLGMTFFGLLVLILFYGAFREMQYRYNLQDMEVLRELNKIAAETPATKPAPKPSWPWESSRAADTAAATPRAPAAEPRTEPTTTSIRPLVISIPNGQRFNAPPNARIILNGPMEATIVNSAERVRGFSGSFKLCMAGTDDCAWTATFSPEPSQKSVSDFISTLQPWPVRTTVSITVKDGAELYTYRKE